MIWAESSASSCAGKLRTKIDDGRFNVLEACAQIRIIKSERVVEVRSARTSIETQQCSRPIGKVGHNCDAPKLSRFHCQQQITGLRDIVFAARRPVR